MTLDRTMMVIHIAAGSLGLITGYAALAAAKGGRLHRKSGEVFVYAMVTMALTGALIAVLRGHASTGIGGLLAAYLVTTAMTTVRPDTARSRLVNSLAMVAGFSTGITSMWLGFHTVAVGGTRAGVPAQIFFLFGAIALAASVSDVGVMRRGVARGAPRLVRHLWRMCFALWIAAASFFLGQADEFPSQLRIPPLLAIPVLIPIVAMIYWTWRLRVKGMVLGNPRPYQGRLSRAARRARQ